MAAEILMPSLLSTCVHFKQLVGYTSTAVHLIQGCCELYVKREHPLVGLRGV